MSDMHDEMILRYLYYLTEMYSGTEEWSKLYNAWRNFGISIGAERYERALEKLSEFDKKFRVK